MPLVDLQNLQMMASGCDGSYAFNTFIFNWVKNYDEQVIILKDAMESLQNKVQIYNNLSYPQLNNIIEKLSRANFELYNYIVIVILDNECEFERFVKTADNQYIFLYTEILTRIQTNSTLKGITRFFVIQKLLDCTDIDDEHFYKIDEMVEERQLKYKSPNTLYSGLTISMRADEFSSSFCTSPFIKVFARNFRNYAKLLPMNMIHREVLKELKYQLCYKINIEFGSNETSKSNLLLGDGISGDVLRDFF